MGITRVANVTGLDKVGIPVVMVCRPNSRSVSVFQGKGVNLDSAKASGLMEAAETYHAENIDRPLTFSSRDDLADNKSVVVIDDLPMCTSGLFHGSKRMLWMEGFDVLNSVSTWLPYDVIHADYSLPTLSSGGCFQLSTNGLAGGNTLLEAVNHALCEVIERDATTLWNYLPDARKQASEIALDTIADDLTVQLIHKCTEAPFSLRVWDASSDVGVPVFIAELHEPLERGAGVWNKPAYGSGCHPNKDVALIRALTEAPKPGLRLSPARETTCPGRITRANCQLILRSAGALPASRPTRSSGSCPVSITPSCAQTSTGWTGVCSLVASARRL